MRQRKEHIDTTNLVTFLREQCSYHLQRIASERIYEKPRTSVIEWHAVNAERYAQAASRLANSSEALEWIERQYANQDMSHVDFRVEAYTRTREALEKSQAALRGAARLREALERLIDAATCIHHWHDAHDGGMVVSGSHVIALWEETERARAALKQEEGK